MLGVIALGDGAMFGSGVSVRSWRCYGKIEDCIQSIRREVNEKNIGMQCTQSEWRFLHNMVKFILTTYHLTPQPPPPTPTKKIFWLSTIKTGNDRAA